MMINQKNLFFRIVSIFVFIGIFVFISVYELYDLQIVHGEEYRENANKYLSGNTVLHAGRGEILDRNGEKLISNTMAFSIIFNQSLWNIEMQNSIISDLIKVLEMYELEYKTSFPIKLVDGQYVFVSNTEDIMSFLKSKKASDNIVTEIQIIEFLRSRYNIIGFYGKDLLEIISVRYEMEQQNFSAFNSFTFAENINVEVITYIRENDEYFSGVEINEQPVREYHTNYAAHILGRVGPIFAEEYAELKTQGYSFNAIIGKDGVEKVFEPYLKAIDGRKASDLVIKGEVVAKGTSIEPIPGQNVELTIDLKLQAIAEESLARNLTEAKDYAIKYNKGGQDIEGGATVVIDVQTGEILALASYPTYSLITFSEDYASLLEDELKPMFNRATNGTYAPGSTYKMVPALAALEEGIVTATTKIQDKGKYTFYDDYQPACWIYNSYRGTHGYVTVTDAIKHSCNYYFYEVGRIMTSSKMEEYANALGLGLSTGIEINEKTGNVAGVTSRTEKGGTWYPGDTLAASIGQSDHLYTPVQLANYIATIANGGTLNPAHLLKKVYSYDYTEVVFENNPEPLNVLDVSEENIQTILKGMNDVVNAGGTGASVFKNYPIQVGAKTGTAQVGTGTATGVYVSFAPYENPEIAVCVVAEHGGSSSSYVGAIVRDIYDHYFGLNVIEEEFIIEEEILG